MTGWRHTERGWDKACGAPSDVPGFINCGCHTPTPDPASPCGECDGSGPHVRPGADTWTNQRHPHVPTRCTCGHAIEATR